MTSDERNQARDWLAAERTGNPDDADQAFASVAEALPRMSPSRGFSAGVMVRVAAATRPVVGWWSSWGVRAAVAASVATLGVALGGWSSRAMLMAAVATAQSLVWGVDQIATGGLVWIETGLTLWATAARAAIVVGRLLVAPDAALLVGANMAVAVCAFFALSRLLASQED